jgi:hypothetical protein
MKNKPILAVGPNGGSQVYRSVRAASRALSGTGSDSLRNSINRRLADGGDYIGGVWVEALPFSGSSA